MVAAQLWTSAKIECTSLLRNTSRIQCHSSLTHSPRQTAWIIVAARSGVWPIETSDSRPLHSDSQATCEAPERPVSSTPLSLPLEPARLVGTIWGWPAAIDVETCSVTAA